MPITRNAGRPPPRSSLWRIVASTRKNLYLWFEQQLAAGPWALGASVTLLDCYIAAMYRWGPRQAWFDDHAPKFAAIAPGGLSATGAGRGATP
ncbi:glutathione S-transferase, theta [Klebsiella pneumoniae]|nr:glutathione S-transferase, theta [Klebsiella pneumoniae]